MTKEQLLKLRLPGVYSPPKLEHALGTVALDDIQGLLFATQLLAGALGHADLVRMFAQSRHFRLWASARSLAESLSTVVCRRSPDR
jgi:hypothetical protein